jgi:carboxypeptidase Taq
MIGYFPAYSFGALAAAQLMEKLKQDMPDINNHIMNGDFAPIRAWMTDRVHQYGSRYTGEELMQNATGKPLSAESWLNHVQGRYLG